MAALAILLSATIIFVLSFTAICMHFGLKYEINGSVDIKIINVEFKVSSHEAALPEKKKYNGLEEKHRVSEEPAPEPLQSFISPLQRCISFPEARTVSNTILPLPHRTFLHVSRKRDEKKGQNTQIIL